MRKATICLIACLFCLSLFGQDGSGFSLSVDPSVLLPLPGSPSEARYGTGLGTSILASWVPPAWSFLSLGGAIDYSLLPAGFDSSLNTIGAAADLGLRLRLGPRFSLNLSGRGGLAYGMLAEAAALTPYAMGSAGAELYLSPSFKLRLDGGYRHYFAASEALYQGLAVSLSAGFNFSQLDHRARTQIHDLFVLPVFPVFYKYYDQNSLGQVTITNLEGGPIRNLRVYLYIRQYMDGPKLCAEIPSLAKGESVTVDLLALFTRQILAILESTKAQAEISIEYEYSGGHKSSTINTSIDIHHRNASIWDDDRKAASFVTMNDPAVMRLARAAAGIARASGFEQLDTSLRQAVGLLEQLRIYGVQYVPDPRVPYALASASEHAVDYLQFPAQTLDYRAGDCDDMAILYAALLEAAGVESAFITVPGHIYTAFAVNMSPAQARGFFSNYGDVIESHGKIWLPVEVTIWNEGFMRAWQIGARQWREAASQGQARLYPIRDAWQLYEPVAMIGSEAAVELPNADLLGRRYTAAMNALIEREMAGFVQTTTAAIARNRQDPAPVNQLGLIYARFGQLAKAEEQFRAALRLRETVAAWVNLGNVLFLKQDYRAAQSAYASAYRLAPRNSSLLVGLALTAAELDDDQAVARYLRELAAADPAAAERYAYIGGSQAGRAREALGPSLSWED